MSVFSLYPSYLEEMTVGHHNFYLDGHSRNLRFGNVSGNYKANKWLYFSSCVTSWSQYLEEDGRERATNNAGELETHAHVVSSGGHNYTIIVALIIGSRLIVPN